MVGMRRQPFLPLLLSQRRRIRRWVAERNPPQQSLWCNSYGSRYSSSSTSAVGLDNEQQVASSSSSSSSIASRAFASSPTRKGQRIHWNQQIIAYGEQNNCQAILELYQQKGMHFNEINFTTTLSRLVKIPNWLSHCCCHDDPRWHHFLSQLVQYHVPDPTTSPRNYANILYSLARLYQNNDNRNNSSTNKNDDDAMTATSVGLVVGVVATKILNRLVSDPAVTVQFIQRGNEQDVANVAWACGQLFNGSGGGGDGGGGGTTTVNNTAMMVVTRPFFRALEENAMLWIHRASASHIVTTLHAADALHMPCHKLLLAMNDDTKNGTATTTMTRPTTTTTTTAERFMSNANVSGIAIVARMCAQRNLPCSHLFAAMDRSILHRLQWNKGWWWKHHHHNTATTSTQQQQHQQQHPSSSSTTTASTLHGNIATIAWACAKLKHRSPLFFQSIEDNATTLVEPAPDDAAPYLLITARACAELGHVSPQFFAAMEHRAHWLIHHTISTGPRHVSMLALACAQFGHGATNLFQAINHHSTQFLRQAQARDIVDLARAYEILLLDGQQQQQQHHHNNNNRLLPSLSPELAAAFSAAKTTTTTAAATTTTTTTHHVPSSS